MIDQTGFDSAHAVQVLASRLPEQAHSFDRRRTGTRIHRRNAWALPMAKGCAAASRIFTAWRRVLRDTISTDAWRIFQESYRAVFNFRASSTDPASGVLELLDNLVVTLAAFAGLAADSMTRGQAWRFLDIGRRIERAAFVSQFLRDSLVEPGTDPVLLEAVLEIGDSSLTYRRRYMTHLETHAVADLLLADETNPRSVAFQLALIDLHLGGLAARSFAPGPQPRSALASQAAHFDSARRFRGIVYGSAGPRARGISRTSFRHHGTVRPAIGSHRAIVFFPRRRFAGNHGHARGARMKYRVTHSTRLRIRRGHSLVAQRGSHEAARACDADLFAVPIPGAALADGEERRLRLFREPCHLVQPAGAAHGAANCRAERGGSPSLGTVRRQPRPFLGKGSANSGHRSRPGNTERPANMFSNRRTCPGRRNWPNSPAHSFPSGRPYLECVLDLTRRIHLDFKFLAGSTQIDTPVEEVFHSHEGVCQDFAHLQICCLRSLGFPARYVSGYLVTSPPPGKERLAGADASHAWVSVFVPGAAGWNSIPRMASCRATATSHWHGEEITTTWALREEF